MQIMQIKVRQKASNSRRFWEKNNPTILIITSRNRKRLKKNKKTQQNTGVKKVSMRVLESLRFAWTSVYSSSN